MKTHSFGASGSGLSASNFSVALLGARMHYAVPRLLASEAMLIDFYTDICASKGWPRVLALVPAARLPTALRRLAARKPKDIPVGQITAFTRFGLEYQWRRATAQSASAMTTVHLWAGARFCKLILEHHPDQNADLYCFNSAGLELLRDWRQRGRRGVVEQTIAPRRVEEHLLRAEEEAFPGWEAPRPRDAQVEAFIAREEAEWQLADTIVCGSEFVKNGVAECGGPADRCAVVPYGVPLGHFRPAVKSPLRGRKLRVLTVGEVGLRKGSHYVYEAARRFVGYAEFRLVGPVGLLPKRAMSLGANVQLTGAVPRSEVIQHFDWADVFLLPSLCEGSATVTYEALSAGLPVITTPNTGSIVEHGVSGFIVPPRNADALVEAIECLLNDPSIVAEMSAAACAQAFQGSLEAYGRRLIEVLKS